MTERLTFVDTNVLVYAHDVADRTKHDRAALFVDTLWADEAGIVSTQVLAEFSSVLIRKRRMTPAEARRIVSPFSAWRVVQADVPMLDAAMVRNQRDGVAWWDCLIIEAALRAGAARLATEDLQAGRTFDRVLKVMDPMAA